MYNGRDMQRGRFFRVLVGILSLSVLGAGCTKGPDAATVAASKPVTLNVWAVIDDIDVYQKIFSAYRLSHPNVTIQFRRLRLEEYETELVNALAEDRGPDVFLIHNTWVSKYMSKIQPMPLTTKIAQQSVVGTLKKEVVYSLINEPTVTVKKFKEEYPDAVIKDMLRTINVSTNKDKRDFQQRVVGIPLSVDTLGMYVNKDLLNAAGIATIPETWDNFQTAVKKLVKYDDKGDILQAGAALGTGRNIERSPDIVSVLMMQNGAEMSAPDGSPTFALIPAKLQNQRDTAPAFQAVSFYKDFADPGKEVYTWNNAQPNSLEAFISGKVAFYFGYGYHLPVIKAQAPKLNLGIAKLPQIQGNPVVNFANYWAWTVSKKTKNVDVAWNLLNFMRTPEESQKFLDAAQRPAALKSQLPAQLENENIGVFASQVLTAQSWYRGADPRAADDAFITMIETSLTSVPEQLPNIVRTASDKVSQTIPFGGVQ